jgi:hypothetical protein
MRSIHEAPTAADAASMASMGRDVVCGIGRTDPMAGAKP